MRLVDLLRALRARWIIVALALFGSVAGGVITARTMPPRYVGHADVLMELVKPDPETGETIPARQLEDYVGTQMRIATSSATTRHMVENFGWVNDPALQAEFNQVAGPGERIEDWLAERLSNSVGVSMPDDSNILRLSFGAPDPQNARTLADAFRVAYLQEIVSRKRDQANDLAARLERQAAGLERRYEAQLAERNAYARRIGAAISTNPNMASRLARALTQRDPALAYSLGPVNGRAAVDAAGIARIEERRDRVSAVATDTLLPEAPANGARSAGSGPIGTGATAAARDLRGASADPHLVTLQQAVRLTEVSYLRIAERLVQARQDARTSDSNFTPFGDAEASGTPVFPVYSKILVTSGIIGLVLGLELALLVELFRRRVRVDHDLATAAGAPVLSTITRPSRIGRRIGDLVALVRGRKYLSLRRRIGRRLRLRASAA